MARTSEARNGISCFLVPADAEGLSADPPERKMGLTGSTTATMRFDHVRVGADRRLGDEGDGLKIALAGLDAGRLGIAAVATGLAQGALDDAVAYAQERETFGKRIIDHQGLGFVLADMAAAVESARTTYLSAARLRDQGLPFGTQASIAKMVATDNAMKVTTDAVQVLGGYGYTRDFPVERYMREAKVMQIFEGTNQIQRLVISRALAKNPKATVVTAPAPPEGELMQLENTSALVTGGASGLGAATAAALAARGARVFALDLPSGIDRAPAVDGVTYVPTDVTDPAQVQVAVDRAAADGPLRTVVNCAGIGPSARILGKKGVHDLELFATVVRINLIGSFNVLALASEQIARTEPDEQGQRGVIVNTASIAAYDGQVGQAAYAASKGGIVGLTLPAARDLAQHGIRVCTIAPGIVETPMLATVSEEFRAGLAAGVPFPQRLAKPEEFASLALTVVDHDYLNGEVIRMDGALRMAPR